MSTKKRIIRKKRTVKRRGSKCNVAKMVAYLMEMLNAIKIYHWNTHSYAQHKATDELHERLGGNIDRFVEVLLGKREPERIRLANAQKIPLHNYKSTSQY